MRKNEMVVRVFLDTNVLTLFLEQNIFPKYVEYSPPVNFVTFEKCWNEIKGGYARHFLSHNFIRGCITEWEKIGRGSQEKDCRDWRTKEVGRQIVFRILNALNLSPEEARNLKKVLGRYNLDFEFGIAEEYQGMSLEEMETSFSLPNQDREATGILRMKQFYALAKSYLRDFYNSLETFRKQIGVEIVHEEQLYSKAHEKRMLLEDSYLPSKDAEIVFSAIVARCDIFATSDKELLRKSLTLGLNHPLRFVRVDLSRSIEEALKEEALKELDAALEEFLLMRS